MFDKSSDKMKTLIIVILDESGSMGNKKADILGGFNEFLRSQKEVTEDTARLYLVKFNTSVNVVHSGIPIGEASELTASAYTPGGGTALYDAIATGVRIADKDKTCEERVICVIMTDGEENSSRETTKTQVRDIISGHESRGDWTFVYIGENPERWAENTGSSRGNVLAYSHDTPLTSFERAKYAVRHFRNSKEKQDSELISSTTDQI